MSVTDTEQDASWRRLSARMLLVLPVQELGQTITALFGVLLAGRWTGLGEWWWGPLGAVAIVAFSVLRWATTRYRITPEQVQLRTGLLHRRTTTTPMDRVRTVDVTASVLHRLLGLAKVDIGTGSQGLGSGLTLDSLPVAEANTLRVELLHRNALAPVDATGAGTVGTVPAGDVVAGDVPSGDVAAAGNYDTELARLDPRWVRFAPFTTLGVVAAAAILGVASNLLSQLRVGDGVEEVESSGGAFDQLRGFPIWLDILMVLAVVIVVVAFVAALSVGGYLLNYWGFRLSRHAHGSLHITRGLMTTRATSIEERRLRGVELSEPLLLRAVHAARLSAITTGLKLSLDSAGGSSLLLPPAPRTVVWDVAAQILGDPDPVEVSLTAHGPAARRRRFTRALLPALFLVAAAGVAIWAGAPPWIALPAMVTVPVAVMLAADRYRSLGHAIAGSYLVLRQGCLGRHRDVLACDGIIGWELRQTFFQRRAGLVTVSATTAAGSQAYGVMDVPLPMALSLGNRASPGLLGEFLAFDPAPAPASRT